MRKLLVFLMLWLTACAQLKPDTGPGALDSGYPTAEIMACGKRYVGLAICAIEQGKPLESLNISIQGYYKGVVKIDSEKCNIHTAYAYEDSKVVRAPLSGPASETCMVDFVVSPEYPRESSSGIVIASLKGRVYIRVLPAGAAHMAQSTKIQQGIDTYLSIPYSDLEYGPTARVVFRGCNTTFDKQLAPQDGMIKVSLKDLRNMFQVENCVFEGAVIGTKTLRVTWQVWAYSDKFVPLSIPDVEVENDWLTVRAEKGVSIIAIDDQYEISNTLGRYFDAKKKHVLRLATVAGRVIIGEWNGKWTWIN